MLVITAILIVEFLCGAHAEAEIQSMTQFMKDQFVDAHNDFRRLVTPKAANMKMVSWDEELAALCLKNVETCKLSHTPANKRKTETFRSTGENLYTGTSTDMHGIIRKATKAWYDEAEDYHFENRTCNQGKMCGHYTQLVWAETRKIGCAIATCESISSGFGGLLICCGYGPAGNVKNLNGSFQAPYIRGLPCTQCDANETCSDKLCSMQGPEMVNTTKADIISMKPTANISDVSENVMISTVPPPVPTQSAINMTCATSNGRSLQLVSWIPIMMSIMTGNIVITTATSSLF